MKVLGKIFWITFVSVISLQIGNTAHAGGEPFVAGASCEDITNDSETDVLTCGDEDGSYEQLTTVQSGAVEHTSQATALSPASTGENGIRIGIMINSEGILVNLGSRARNVNLQDGTTSDTLPANQFTIDATWTSAVNAYVTYDDGAGNAFFIPIVKLASGNTLKGWTVTAGTPNAATTATTTTTEEEQQQAAATYTQNRATNIANNQPNVTGFIDGTFEQGGGSLGNFGLVANEAGFTSRFSSSLGRIWSEMDRNTAKAIAGSALNGNVPPYLAQDKVLQNGLILAPASTEGEQSQTAAVVDPELSLSGAIKSNADENTYGSAASVENTSRLSAAQQRGYDVWMQVYGAKSEAGNSESTLWVGYAGAHKFINPNFLIGGLVQMDWADESNNTAGSSADGTGWMVGPYLAYKAPDQNLFFDVRAAWGRSDNDITTAGATGSFETERWMVSAKVSGLFRENGWDIRPAVSASYFEETQESYTDSTSTVIASQTFTQGEIRFGPTFSYDMMQDDGSIIRPKAGVNGVWNFDVNNGANSQGAVLGSGDLRARFDAGVTIIGTNMWSLDLSGFYDGIGINNYEAYGGKARVTVPLQ